MEPMLVTTMTDGEERFFIVVQGTAAAISHSQTEAYRASVSQIWEPVLDDREIKPLIAPPVEPIVNPMTIGFFFRGPQLGDIWQMMRFQYKVNSTMAKDYKYRHNYRNTTEVTWAVHQLLQSTAVWWGPSAYNCGDRLDT